jgi:uncharacterized protein YjbI with pentapeptide repeats
MDDPCKQGERKMSARQLSAMRRKLSGDMASFAALRTAAASMFLLLIASAPSQAACGDQAAPGVDWTECNKTRLMMGQADLSGGEFVQTFFSSSDLRGVNLADANLSLAEFSNASLAGANLSGATLEKAVATRADFSGADLSGANLTGAEFSRTNFQRTNLSGADFTNSEMNRSDFSEADLTGATMSKAELARVILRDAVISGVPFSYSNLSRADLTGTDLEDAEMTGTYMFLTRLDGADLSRTKGLTQGQIALACGDAKTALPEGLTAPQNWPCPDYNEE